MTKLKIDTETGEIIPAEIMVQTEKAPAILVDVNEVAIFHKEPEKLADKIREQAGYAVFDISTQKGRDACRTHASNIIRCISPALKASTALAETAKQVVKQDLYFRKVFEEKVREIAAFHRRPLTEWEEEQERIKEQERLEQERFEQERRYMSDWDDAIAFNELLDLRKEKEAAEAEKQRLAIEADITAKKLWARENADGYQFLFADISQLVTLDMDEFQKVIVSRVIKYKEQAEREELIVITDEPEKSPGRNQLITVIASRFFVTAQQAESWLIEEFGAETKKQAQLNECRKDPEIE